jgi:uncharacterized damage-inducible protein DinB
MPIVPGRLALLDQFKTFARYNSWANQRLYAACALLDDQAYYADCGAFFGSIHRTLNHLVLTDRIWLGRLEGKPFAVTGLDQVLYEDRAELRAAREAEDLRVERVVGGFSEAQLSGDLEYKTTKGAPQRTNLGLVLSHLFNHQTHHRGQVHDMLSQAGQSPPPLDLLLFIRN